MQSSFFAFHGKMAGWVGGVLIVYCVTVVPRTIDPPRVSITQRRNTPGFRRPCRHCGGGGGKVPDTIHTALRDYLTADYSEEAHGLARLGTGGAKYYITCITNERTEKIISAVHISKFDENQGAVRMLRPNKCARHEPRHAH